MNEDYTQKLERLLETSITSYTRLLEESETRIAETNKMVQRMTEISSSYMSSLNNLTTVYDKHISELEESRDRVLEQNKALIEMAHQMCEEHKALREQLVVKDDKMLNFAERIASKSNISVTQ